MHFRRGNAGGGEVFGLGKAGGEDKVPAEPFIAVAPTMQKLFVSPNLVEVESLKNVLEQAGIQSWIKNQRSSSLAGEVPFAEVFPELWVLNDADYAEAQQFLENWRAAKPYESTGWTCGRCGESHEKDFTSCWQCGSDRPRLD